MGKDEKGFTPLTLSRCVVVATSRPIDSMPIERNRNDFPINHRTPKGTSRDLARAKDPC